MPHVGILPTSHMYSTYKDHRWFVGYDSVMRGHWTQGQSSPRHCCECIVARAVAVKLTATSALHISATKSASIRLLWNRSIEVPPHKASSPHSNKGFLLLLFYFLNFLAPSLFSLQGAPLCLLSSKLRWSSVPPTAPPLFLRALPKHPNRWKPLTLEAAPPLSLLTPPALSNT